MLCSLALFSGLSRFERAGRKLGEGFVSGREHRERAGAFQRIHQPRGFHRGHQCIEVSGDSRIDDVGRGSDGWRNRQRLRSEQCGVSSVISFFSFSICISVQRSLRPGAGQIAMPAALDRFPGQGLIQSRQTHQAVHHRAERGGFAKFHAEHGRHQIQMECSGQPPVQGADDDQRGCDYVKLSSY